MKDDATPAKVRLTDGLGPDLPDSIADELPDDCAQYRKDRQAAMAETLERHRAVAERLRAMLRRCDREAR